MSMLEKHAYLMAIWSRYAASTRPQKSLILNEYYTSTQLGRKYVIAQLARFWRTNGVKSCPPGQPVGTHPALGLQTRLCGWQRSACRH